MSTRKRKVIRKTAPILGAAAAAGLFSLMGTAMAADISAQPVSQIVLSDEAEVTLAGWYNGDYYSNPAPTRGFWGKGTVPVKLPVIITVVVAAYECQSHTQERGQRTRRCRRLKIMPQRLRGC